MSKTEKNIVMVDGISLSLGAWNDDMKALYGRYIDGKCNMTDPSLGMHLASGKQASLLIATSEAVLFTCVNGTLDPIQLDRLTAKYMAFIGEPNKTTDRSGSVVVSKPAHVSCRARLFDLAMAESIASLPCRAISSGDALYRSKHVADCSDNGLRQKAGEKAVKFAQVERKHFTTSIYDGTVVTLNVDNGKEMHREDALLVVGDKIFAVGYGTCTTTKEVETAVTGLFMDLTSLIPSKQKTALYTLVDSFNGVLTVNNGSQSKGKAKK